MHIVTANEMYEMDRVAMEKGGIDGRILMENAGRSITESMIPLLAKNSRILILVGAGNNGGDGFVIGRTLCNQRFHVTVLQLVPDEKIRGDAAYHKQLYINFGGKVHVDDQGKEIAAFLKEATVVIDAIFGIGIKGKLRPPFHQIIEAVNQSNTVKLSVDIPSGIPADEGVSFDTGVWADYTFVIEAPKMSAFLQHTAKYYGKWEVVKIGLPLASFDQVTARKVWTEEQVHFTLPKRDDYSHKGTHGKGLIVGGSREMPGSIAMTALSSLRSGAGLVSVGTVNEVIPSIVSHCAEATFIPLDSEKGVITGSQCLDYSVYNAIAIGMGMGRSEDTAELTRQLIKEANCPVIVDADGLYHISDDLELLKQREFPSILTPHPGEMSRLTGIPVKEIISKPFRIAEEFSKTYQVHLILKGPFTIVTDPKGKQWVNTSGNAGLAKGGSGDVLSGILLSMVMQPQLLVEALANGCYIHGKAADNLIVNKHSKQDLLATDVIQGLASVFRTFS
ncbi:NAD(P)H-hydrate dehydratase [Aquibacillus albus]|uniref:Bifunctional NAD(P)H-hydrate repair enzyme n=1 Tax=Aquibacillus albus TaxID=1168171 RepID=A0ABS2MZ51_9BACI|nr:NAD(P)H-hydrate epimerase [Aquibacillus albus]